jgi:hypothetical protein
MHHQRICSTPYKLQDYVVVAITIDEPPDLSYPLTDWFVLQRDIVEELIQHEPASFAEATKDPWELIPPTPGRNRFL